MKLKIRSLHMENFKGIKSLDVTFSGKTKISGQNAVGKQLSLMRLHGFCLIRTVPERKSSMSDHWIRTATALITWRLRL